ncbi:MAG: helix-turn-helix transcriptional regulator [Patescibacteria group bacterium]
MKFGERLRLARKKHKLSTQQLSEKCGVSRSYITLIENSKRLPGDQLLYTFSNVFKLKGKTLISWYLEDIRESLEEKFAEESK